MQDFFQSVLFADDIGLACKRVAKFQEVIDNRKESLRPGLAALHCNINILW